MANDTKPLNDTAPAATPSAVPSAAQATASPDSAVIGYEAADPNLHAPFWSEALQSGTPKSLR